MIIQLTLFLTKFLNQFLLRFTCSFTFSSLFAFFISFRVLFRMTVFKKSRFYFVQNAFSAQFLKDLITIKSLWRYTEDTWWLSEQPFWLKKPINSNKIVHTVNYTLVRWLLFRILSYNMAWNFMKQISYWQSRRLRT